MEALLNWVSARPLPSRVRLTVGALINVGGVAALVAGVAGAALRDPAAAEGIRASAIAGAATGLGAVALLAMKRLGDRGLGHFMALGAGMMLAAALFSLILPAIDLSRTAAAAEVAAAVALGWIAMMALDRLLPHLHAAPQASRPLPVNALRLMVVAIAAHNLPEGFAVGAGFGGGSDFGWVTALSIGIQNVPEGLIVATALWSLGMSRLKAGIGALLTGLIEPLGAAVGVLVIGTTPVALPLSLGLAGGAMLFVVFDELLPEAMERGRGIGRFGLFAAGFAAVAGLVGGL